MKGQRDVRKLATFSQKFPGQRKVNNAFLLSLFHWNYNFPNSKQSLFVPRERNVKHNFPRKQLQEVQHVYWKLFNIPTHMLCLDKSVKLLLKKEELFRKQLLLKWSFDVERRLQGLCAKERVRKPKKRRILEKVFKLY